MVRHTADIGQLSRAVRDWEAGPDDEAPEVNLWAGNADEDAHPLVLELRGEHGDDGVSAALAYMAEGFQTDAPALIRWMIDGAFKGAHLSDAAFCRDHFAGGNECGSLTDHLSKWDAAAVGFSLWEELSPAEVGDLFDWEQWASWVVNLDEAVFQSIAAANGVYVFDTSIDIESYREDQ